jgi:hypothetical protein
MPTLNRRYYVALMFAAGLSEAVERSYREQGLAQPSNSVIQKELQPIGNTELAIPAGLEPATRGVEIRYSVQLSYGTVLPRP